MKTAGINFDPQTQLWIVSLQEDGRTRAERPYDRFDKPMLVCIYRWCMEGKAI